MTSSESTYPFISEEARERYLSFNDEKARRWWPSASEERMVDTSFGQTFLRIVGEDDETAPPLVLIPGDGETSLAWTFVVESLSKEFRVYALDLINDIGRSIPVIRPDGGVVIEKPQHFVEWLYEVLTKISPLRRVNVVAHSYGAWQASLFALAHPEMVQRLVLLAPPATVLRPPMGLLLRAILYDSLPFKPVMKWYMHWFAPASVQQEQSRVIIDEMIQEQLLARKCFKPRKFILPTTLTDEEWGKLSRSVPTLFVVGDKEVVYSPENAIRRLERVAPSVKSIVVPDADHHLALVQPQRVQELILQFLKSES